MVTEGVGLFISVMFSIALYCFYYQVISTEEPYYYS